MRRHHLHSVSDEGAIHNLHGMDMYAMEFDPAWYSRWKAPFPPRCLATSSEYSFTKVRYVLSRGSVLIGICFRRFSKPGRFIGGDRALINHFGLFDIEATKAPLETVNDDEYICFFPRSSLPATNLYLLVDGRLEDLSNAVSRPCGLYPHLAITFVTVMHLALERWVLLKVRWSHVDQHVGTCDKSLLSGSIRTNY